MGRATPPIESAAGRANGPVCPGTVGFAKHRERDQNLVLLSRNRRSCGTSYRRIDARWRSGLCWSGAISIASYNLLVTTAPYAGLPGAELVTTGLADLLAGRESVSSLLVEIGAPRLRSLGLAVPATAPLPEHRLYALLALDEPASAHSRYNALVRRLVSFERALACAD